MMKITLRDLKRLPTFSVFAPVKSSQTAFATFLAYVALLDFFKPAYLQAYRDWIVFIRVITLEF